MTSVALDFMPKNRQKLPEAETLGAALRRVAVARWPANTAKHVERAWGCDRVTAQNVAKGHAGARVLQGLLRAGDWAAWIEIGEALTGRTLDDHFTIIIEETERARERAEDRRRRLRDMEARAASHAGVGTGLGS